MILQRMIAWLSTCAIATVAFGGPSAIPRQTADWQPGDPFPGVDGSVYAMTSWDPDGPGPEKPLLVIGGNFRIAGNALVNSIAAWNGQSWKALGSGVGGPNPFVYALTV